MRTRPSFLLSLAIAGMLAVPALFSDSSLDAQEGYRLPPPEVVEILDAPEAPSVVTSPDRQVLVLAHRRNMPTIAEMSQPMLRLAGLRINPMTNGSFSPSMVTGYSLMDVATGAERSVGLPSEDGWGMPMFSPSGEHFAMTRATTEGTELWVVDVATAEARRLVGPRLNSLVGWGSGCQWMGMEPELLCHMVDPDRGPAPQPSMVPAGPIVQESIADDSPVRTYQDLLEDEDDVALWAYYRTSVPVLVDAATGETTTLGGPAIYSGVAPSPSGEFYLVEKIVPPYSYLVTERSFPQVVEVWNAQGEMVAELARIPLGEGVPIGGVTIGRKLNAVLIFELRDKGDMTRYLASWHTDVE